jgi:hypothetical protein
MRKNVVCERCGLRTATYRLNLCNSMLCEGCSYDMMERKL